MRKFERLEQHFLRHLVCAGLDHGQALLRPHHDQIERRLLLRLGAGASPVVSRGRRAPAPSACFASLPLSNVISRPPISTETEAWRSVAIAMWFLHLPVLEGGGLSQRRRPAEARSNFHPL